MTLGLANITNFNPNVKYISVQQFEYDLIFFYNTLKYAVIYKGSNCVTNERWTKDGIVVYKNLLQKFKYGGILRHTKINFYIHSIIPHITLVTKEVL